MLALTPLQSGTRGVGKKVESVGLTPLTLADMCITKNQSSIWQALAVMLGEHFEVSVAVAKEAAGEATSAFMLRAAKKRRPHGKPQKGKKADAMCKDLEAAMDSGKLMLCECARLHIGAIQAWQPLLAEAVACNIAKQGLKPPWICSRIRLGLLGLTALHNSSDQT
jgi:hypothetical protein